MFSQMFVEKRSINYQPVDQHYQDNVNNGYSSESQSHHGYEPKLSTRGFGLSRRSSTIITLTLVIIGYLAGWFTREVMGYHYLRTTPKMVNPPQVPVLPQSVTAITTEKIFRNNRTFDVDREDAESDQAWDTYFSRFVSLDGDVAKSSGLGPTVSARGRYVYSVAAYHQLHCVHVIRYAWNQLKTQGPNVLEEPYPGLEALAEGYTIEGHTSHCLDMIRQALECHADPTLEPMMSDDGETISTDNIASGWGGTPHVCRDFNALTAWVDAPEQHPILSVEVFVNADGSSHGAEKPHSHGSHDHSFHGPAKEMTEHDGEDEHHHEDGRNE